MADLLVVVDDFNRRRAALVQAKMAARKGTVQISGTKNKAQLDLFTRWPVFDFEETIYGLKGLDLHRGGRGLTSGMYGIIDRHWSNPPRHPSWKQMVPASVPGSVGAAPSLGRFIVRMIFGTAGRDATPGSAARDWVQIVDALMSVTYTKYFHDRPSLGPPAFPRGNTTAAFFLQGQAKSIYTFTDGGLAVDTEPEIIRLEREPEIGALSLLHIIKSPA
ncbi:hypothetical protein GGE07_006091 [Sinorhizobium terangae]|uniref:Uncharacterized protein n=1 Tax=Sinorhizobium terangae TaxID=110322 RepID=A0A6N7LEY9_SINTE|nr:hypothetical protein [Sinorhizobium terangae]MBB4189409.1 hypothetical protein [Sinorhizobium terangae]MQX15779.1 hypothetical protein [Sinorhizobium terangae]